MQVLELPQRVPSFDDLLNLTLKTVEEQPELIDVLKELFVCVTTPDLEHVNMPAESARQFYQQAMTEWILFDAIVDAEGLTLFECASLADLSLAECAMTQFYSEFFVIEQDPTSAISVLRHPVTGGQYVVHDKSIASNPQWAKGLLGVRLARVGETWHNLSALHLHDNNDELVRCEHNPEHDDATIKSEAFICHIASLVSPGGILSQGPVVAKNSRI